MADLPLRLPSGKSTLFLALARLLSPLNGTIRIDDVDLQAISLDFLRSRLCIIPQDPFILDGSVRENLEVDDIHRSDTELQSALSKVGLWDFISAQSTDAAATLATDISAFSLSHGQKQLFAFARALLSDTRLILMDEPTSHIDSAADASIQRLITEDFVGRTILAIVHRIDNVKHFDRVIVMQDGSIVEEGAPGELLQAPGSAFRRLVEADQL